MITNIPNWQSLTVEEILNYLLETEWLPNHRPVTIALLKSSLPAEAYALVRLTLEQATIPEDDSLESKLIAADISDALAAMRIEGISLAPEDRQAAIHLLAQKGRWPDSVRDAVKALGGSMVPRWESLGYQNEPTIESIQIELAELARTERIKSFKSRLDSILNQIGTAEQPQAVVSLRLIADELEA